MAPKRTRSRRRGRDRTASWSVAITLCVAVVLLVGSGVPSVAFETGQSERSPSVDVVEDSGGALGLNVTSALEEGSNDDCLVRLTNHLGQSGTVNVSLRGGSRDLGTLKTETAALGQQSGDSVEFSLDDGASNEVSMEVKNGTAGNTTAFNVSVVAPGLSVALDGRTAPIEMNAGTTCS